MSLVAYEASTDSENESSDEDNEESNCRTKVEVITGNKQLNLPAPKKQPQPEFTEVNKLNMSFKLPEPIEMQQSLVVEEDDEFLKKKAIPTINPPKKPVRIIIPALNEFNDVKEHTNTSCDTSNKRIQNSSKILGLLSSLPKPKGEQLFDNGKQSGIKSKSNVSKPSLIPYSLMEHNKTDSRLNKKKNTNSNKISVASVKGICYSDSDSDDIESVDFFSLNKEDELPIVADSEIKVMVAKKTLKLAQVSAKFAEMTKTTEDSNSNLNEHTSNENLNSCALEEEAINHLLGSSAKRRRNQTELMNIVDISHEQVMPDRDTWIRNALAQSTQYIPKGKTNDEELIPGSKRKHQITYLAHQAKTNESELQAMWANNRQTRRQTQSKYGF